MTWNMWSLTLRLHWPCRNGNSHSWVDRSWEDRDVGGSVLVSAFSPGVGASDIVGLSGGVGAAPLRCLCSIPGACMHVHYCYGGFHPCSRIGQDLGWFCFLCLRMCLLTTAVSTLAGGRGLLNHLHFFHSASLAVALSVWLEAGLGPDLALLLPWWTLTCVGNDSLLFSGEQCWSWGLVWAEGCAGVFLAGWPEHQEVSYLLPPH